jgi:hypothetical protein
VRSLEINLKYLSHDWHVQPVVKDPIAFSALGGALGEQRPELYAVTVCPRNLVAISLLKCPSETQPHNLFGIEKCLAGRSDWLRNASLDASIACGARDIADFFPICCD